MEYIINEISDIIISEVDNIYKLLLKRTDIKFSDYIIINNSFFKRNTKVLNTTKNQYYLCIKKQQTEININSLFLVAPGTINVDAKPYNAKDFSTQHSMPLDEAIKEALGNISQLLFVLIGKLDDVPADVAVESKEIHEIRYSPNVNDTEVVMNDLGGLVITIKQLTDPSSIWDKVNEFLATKTIVDLDRLKDVFYSAFRKLTDEAKIKLYIPLPTTPNSYISFLAHLRNSIRNKRVEYEESLKQFLSESTNSDKQMTELMRIAYSFADDVIKIYQLLVRIADLKPIVLWCTIFEHYMFVQTIKQLPLVKTKSGSKTELIEYRDMIANSRNHAFHTLFSFDRSIEADLSGLKINARRLTLLPKYAKQKDSVIFDYEDREILESFRDITRTQEEVVPVEFWKLNTEVMRAFEELLTKTEITLWALNRARIV